MLKPFPWHRYSKKLIKRILSPRLYGRFTEEDTKKRGMRFARGNAGAIDDSNYIELTWIVDPEDGTIVDATYQTFGQSALIGAAEFATELLIGKNYDQAKRISAELIDREARDKGSSFAFPNETYPHLNLVIDAIDQAAEMCGDIPLPTAYAAPPAPTDIGDVPEGGYPGFEALNVQQKLSLIEEILNQDIRPYISLDAGGVEVINLVDNQVIISYSGACTSCYSSTGATLSYIQQTLRAKLSPALDVTPDFTLE